MPPKRKNQKKSDLVTDEAENDVEVEASVDMPATTSLQQDMEALFDRRFKQQTSHINDLFSNHLQTTKSALDEIKSSQAFLGSKFDDLVASIKEVKAENVSLRKANEQLQQRVKQLEEKANASGKDVEDLRRYSRRDTLEISGIPVIAGENTNAIVLKVARLAAPECEFDESMLSVSHRLPSTRGFTPKIIAKFTRRDLRDEIYKKRRNLSSKSTSDLGLDVLNRIYVNESLTAQSRAIYSEAKKFRSQYNFKFIWTRNERCI